METRIGREKTPLEDSTICRYGCGESDNILSKALISRRASREAELDDRARMRSVLGLGAADKAAAGQVVEVGATRPRQGGEGHEEPR